MMFCRHCKYFGFDRYSHPHCYYHDVDPEDIKSCTNYIRITDSDFSSLLC